MRIITPHIYRIAVSGILEKQEAWREEWLAFNINDTTWQQKQAKYQKKLVQIQTARLETDKFRRGE